MGSPFEKIALYRRTLPHHRSSQVWWRLRFLFRKHVRGRYAPLPKTAPEWDGDDLGRVRSYALEHAETVGVPQRFFRVLEDNELVLLNYPVNIENGIPWLEKAASKLWRYHLHYHEWCRWVALNPNGSGEDKTRVLDWLRDWCAKNPVGPDISWDPFVVTQRLCNWALIFSVAGTEDEGLGRAYAQHRDFLEKNLEQDVLANHLLKNLCALVLAGTLTKHACAEVAMALLEGELKEQILGDGGHFERSPMYHLQVLEDLLLVHAVLESPPYYLVETLKRMLEFAEQMRHPDGEIAQFNDAARDVARPAEKLLELARLRLGVSERSAFGECRAFDESGFYILTQGNTRNRMIVHAGEHGPPYQLGHAHSDLLSYELSMDGKRLIVDSGVQGYSGDHLREYCRSTRAHNTVSVNGLEQLEAWDVFRVGRRSAAKVLDFAEASYGQYFHGEHNAFAPFIHRRRIHCDRLGLWFILDEIEGPGVIEAESYIHLHPLWTLALRRGYYSIRITETVYRIFPIGPVEGQTVRGQKEPFQQGWYCPEIGKSQQGWCLTLRARGMDSLRFGYAIVPVSGHIRSGHDLKMYVDMLDVEHGFGSRETAVGDIGVNEDEGGGD